MVIASKRARAARVLIMQHMIRYKCIEAMPLYAAYVSHSVPLIPDGRFGESQNIHTRITTQLRRRRASGATCKSWSYSKKPEKKPIFILLVSFIRRIILFVAPLFDCVPVQRACMYRHKQVDPRNVPIAKNSLRV